MTRRIYVPIFDSFFESSIMREELVVRFVMLALIRLAWRSGSNGDVDVDPVIFAQSLNLPVADVKRAVDRLMQPDPASSQPDEDGRRIVPINPDRPFRGWRLVNWPRYSAMVHRVNDAARKREERHRGESTTATSSKVQKRPGTSVNVQERPPVSRNGGNGATKRNETKRNETKKEPEDHRRSAPTDRDVNFETFWTVYPRKVGKLKALDRWRCMPQTDRARALEAVSLFRDAWLLAPQENRRFLPHPTTWLNQGRWNDDPEEWRRQAGTTAVAPTAPSDEGKHGRSAEELLDPPVWVRDVLRRIRAREPWTTEELDAVHRWEAGEDVPPLAPHPPEKP